MWRPGVAQSGWGETVPLKLGSEAIRKRAPELLKGDRCGVGEVKRKKGLDNQGRDG